MSAALHAYGLLAVAFGAFWVMGRSPRHITLDVICLMLGFVTLGRALYLLWGV